MDIYVCVCFQGGVDDVVRMVLLYLIFFIRNLKCIVFQGKSIQGSLLVIFQYEFENIMYMKLEDNILIFLLYVFKYNLSYSKFKF